MKSTAIPVLHIITKLELGGAQQNTLYTVENLDQRQFISHLIAGPGGMLNDEASRILGERFAVAPRLIRKIRPMTDLRAMRELRGMIRERKPQIVHTHSSKAGILGRLAAAAEKVPVVIHSIHGFGIKAVKNPIMQRALLAAERAAARRTTHFIAVSRNNIDEGIGYRLFDESKVSLIYSGIRLERFRNAPLKPDLAKALGIPHGSPVVGMVACFKPQKAPLDFVELAGRIHAEEPRARFLMLGDGALRPQVEERISELELEGIVILAGWRRDVPELIKLMDVSVLTSRWEGLPRVIPQSLSAGVPVVVTRAGGSAEAVREGETGFVIEQGDIEGMTEKILLLLRNPDLAENMGRAGPASVKDWDINGMVRAQEKLYLRLLEEMGERNNPEGPRPA